LSNFVPVGVPPWLDETVAVKMTAVPDDTLDADSARLMALVFFTVLVSEPAGPAVKLPLEET
jgi:hypothetical protein